METALAIAQLMFQFLKGSIKRAWDAISRSVWIWFQFLKGSIKSPPCSPEDSAPKFVSIPQRFDKKGATGRLACLKTLFQFLKGSIKRALQREAHHLTHVSIPQRFDKKDCLTAPCRLSTHVSIPQRFDKKLNRSSLVIRCISFNSSKVR